jgi:hypothetical protein
MIQAVKIGALWSLLAPALLSKASIASMQPLKFLALPRSRTAQAVSVTVLYCALTLFVLYAPIDASAPFVKLFGSQSLARQTMTAFVQVLFWPLVAILAVTALRGCYEFVTRKRMQS